jgi:hypothetical protein
MSQAYSSANNLKGFILVYILVLLAFYLRMDILFGSCSNQWSCVSRFALIWIVRPVFLLWQSVDLMCGILVGDGLMVSVWTKQYNGYCNSKCIFHGWDVVRSLRSKLYITLDQYTEFRRSMLASYQHHSAIPWSVGTRIDRIMMALRR